MEFAIKLRNVSKTFADGRRELTAVKNIDLEIYPGEFFVFVGPSGCGKSTLLRIMSGLEKKYVGTIEYARNIQKLDMSFVFQHFALLPWMTIADNTGIGLVARGVPENERKQKVEHNLELLGLTKFAMSYPRELSGGMRQRVGIARALATDPHVIFMDEPFSELDSFTAEELRLELLRIWERTKTTIVMVTHVIEEALELADRIAVMTPRPGRLEKIVDIKMLRPRQERTEAFYKLEDELYEIIKP